MRVTPEEPNDTLWIITHETISCYELFVLVR